MIRTGIWTGQRWTARSGHGPEVKVNALKFERGEIVFTYLTARGDSPQDIMDLTSFTQRYQLIRND